MVLPHRAAASPSTRTGRSQGNTDRATAAASTVPVGTRDAKIEALASGFHLRGFTYAAPGGSLATAVRSGELDLTPSERRSASVISALVRASCSDADDMGKTSRIESFVEKCTSMLAVAGMICPHRRSNTALGCS